MVEFEDKITCSICKEQKNITKKVIYEHKIPIETTSYNGNETDCFSDDAFLETSLYLTSVNFYPEGRIGERQYLNICPDCFILEVIPLLEKQFGNIFIVKDLTS